MDSQGGQHDAETLSFSSFIFHYPKSNYMGAGLVDYNNTRRIDRSGVENVVLPFDKYVFVFIGHSPESMSHSYSSWGRKR